MADSPRIEELKRRVQLDPASIAFAALAEEYRRAGQFEDSIETCKAGLLRHPAYLSARVTLGRSLIELGRYDEAREELEQVLKVAPENLAAIRGLAEIHHRRGEVPESVPETVVEEPGAGSSPATPDAASVPDPETSRGPVPIRPVRLASMTPGDAPPDVSSTAEARATEGTAPVAAPVPRVPIPVSPAAHAPGTASAPAPAATRPPAEAATAAPPPSPFGSDRSIPLEPRPVAPPAHSDAPALPELEAFLARIIRAREALETSPSQR
jgi:tetratricopeptide (TPR) repeat protein